MATGSGKTSDRKLLPLDQVRPATGGSKADAARRLEELSQIKEAGFVTSPGVVVPFGVMEESLNKASVRIYLVQSRPQQGTFF